MNRHFSVGEPAACEEGAKRRTARTRTVGPTLREGFTLIEVIVALSVLGIACTALFSLLSSSLFNLRKLEDVHHYQLICEDVMNRMQLLPKLPPQGTASGTVATLGADWSVSVAPWFPATLSTQPAAAIMKIDVNVSWNGRAGRRTLRLESMKPATINYDNYDLGQAIDKAIPR